MIIVMLRPKIYDISVTEFGVQNLRFLTTLYLIKNRISQEKHLNLIFY